jgi:hypothetical protein
MAFTSWPERPPRLEAHEMRVNFETPNGRATFRCAPEQ